MRPIIGVGVTLLFAALTVFLWKQSQVSVASNQIAPDNTVLYIEIPHLVQTARNLPDTALYQIFQEPSVRRFLKQPGSNLWQDYQSSWDSFLKLGCTPLFFCATDPATSAGWPVFKARQMQRCVPERSKTSPSDSLDAAPFTFRLHSRIRFALRMARPESFSPRLVDGRC